MLIHIVMQFIWLTSVPLPSFSQHFLLKNNVLGVNEIFHVIGIDIGRILVVDMHVAESLDDIILMIHRQTVGIETESCRFAVLHDQTGIVYRPNPFASAAAYPNARYKWFACCRWFLI